MSPTQEEEFVRAFEGEAYVDLPKIRRKARNEEKHRFLVPAGFKCANVPQLPCGKGSVFGTFAHEYPIRSSGIPTPLVAKVEKKENLKNIYTSPAKIGGPGYVEGPINKFPPYAQSQYERGLEISAQERQASKAKRVSTAPFVSGSACRSYFNKKIFQGLGPVTFSPKEKLKLPTIPWRPPSCGKQYLSNYEYISANKSRGRQELQIEATERVKMLKKRLGDEKIFRPVSMSCHTHPVRSVLIMNAMK